MKIQALASLLTFCLLVQGSVLANNIPDEVRQFRSTNKDATTDISEIANRYVSLGAKRDAVEKFLLAQKFELHVPTASSESRTLIATFVQKSLVNFIGFHDEIRLIISFENDMVVQVDGKLIYRAL